MSQKNTSTLAADLHQFLTNGGVVQTFEPQARRAPKVSARGHRARPNWREPVDRPSSVWDTLKIVEENN